MAKLFIRIHPSLEYMYHIRYVGVKGIPRPFFDPLGMTPRHVTHLGDKARCPQPQPLAR
jgi:hypothetical protein